MSRGGPACQAVKGAGQVRRAVQERKRMGGLFERVLGSPCEGEQKDCEGRFLLVFIAVII